MKIFQKKDNKEKSFLKIKTCDQNKKSLKIKVILLILCCTLFLFHFWIAFPGFISPDTTRALNLEKYGWHPVIIPYILEFLFNLFGTHVFLYLLLQLIPFYIGMIIIGFGLLNRFKSWWVLLFLVPILTVNIFFMNIWLSSSSLSPIWVFLFYALIFNRIMANNLYQASKGFYFILLMIFILALLFRHEAICQVWPVWLFLIFKVEGILKKITIFLISIFLTLSITIVIPKLLMKPSPYPPPNYHVMLYHIAEACVPANDSSCFDNEWYLTGKNWQSVQKIYKKNNADLLGLPWKKDIVFKPTIDYKVLKKRWIKSIAKYPHHFIRHRFQKFYKKLWLKKYHHPNYKEQNYRKVLKYCSKYNDCLMRLSTEKETIYDFLNRYLLKIPTYFFVFGCWLLAAVSIILMTRNNSDILVFTFINAIGGCALSIIIPAIVPIAWYRYMHSILFSFILANIGFVSYILIRRKKVKN